MSNRYTYEQVAKNWDLWGTYVDPGATMSDKQFKKLTIAKKIAIQVELFGPEEAEEKTEEERLALLRCDCNRTDCFWCS